MNADDANATALAAAIQRYLREHPYAADNLQGVARWWLGGHAGNDRLSTVKHALEQLVRDGVMISKSGRDGTVIYECNRAQESHDT